MKKLLYTILLSATVFIFNVNKISAVEYGGIGGRPAHPDATNSRTDSIFVHTVNPGGTVSDGIRVINNTKDPKTLVVYAVDSVVSSGGAFSCAQKSEDKNDIGAWTVLAKNEITLASLTNEVVPFDIKLPESASVGEHNGCIVIEEKKDPNAKPTGQSGVILSFRTGIRIALLVPGEIIRKITPVGLSVLKKTNGDFTLTPKVHNEGNVSVDTTINTNVFSVLGLSVANFSGQYPILRGETSELNFDLKKPFWGGLYKVSYSLSYDANSEAGVGILSGKELTSIEGSSTWFFSTPTIIGFVLEIIILSILILFIYRFIKRKKEKKWIKNDWQSYVVTSTDTIQNIAERGNISWNKLAKVNNLSAPYVLHEGETLRVPPSVK